MKINDDIHDLLPEAADRALVASEPPALEQLRPLIDLVEMPMGRILGYWWDSSGISLSIMNMG